jgi:glycosyltransferase involved in cell wall biosynthesis
MKVLIISYYWPPSGGSGVQRWMYFAKYLGEFGIEPTIITVKENQASYSSVDESLVQEIEHIRTFKTSTLEPIRLYSFLKSGNAKKSIPQGNVGGKKPGMIDKMARFIRANYFIPDARVGWNPYAFKKAKQLLQTEKFDFVITTGPPQSTHLVGLKLKKMMPNICWIADFRDPWTEVYYNELFKRTKSNEAKDQKMELDVLQESDMVLTVGPSMQKLLQSKIENQKGKVKFVFNGFDETKIRKAKVIANDIFTIAYIGTLSANYPYKSIVAAFTQIKETAENRKLQINLAGNIEADVLADFKALESESILINYHGIIAHNEALSLMKSADLLLLCLPVYEGSSIFVSGKLLEYVACNKPILGVFNPESDAGFLVENYTQGKVFLPENQLEIFNFIQDALNGNLTMKTDLRSPSEFERKATAKELADLLKDI